MIALPGVLVRVDFSRTNITRHIAAGLSEALASPACRLEVLRMRECRYPRGPWKGGVPDDWTIVAACQQLCKGIKANQSLSTLDLGYNDLGDEGTQIISKALEVNRSITCLKLQNNNIYAEGGQAIGKMLEYNCSITSINLASNSIGDDGCRAISQGLGVTSAARLGTTIDLQGNNIGVLGGQAIGQMLEVSKSITTINLSYNKVSDEGSKAIGTNQGSGQGCPAAPQGLQDCKPSTLNFHILPLV